MSFTRTLRAVGGAVVAGALLFGSAPAAFADQIRNDQWPLKAFDAESVWKVSTGRGVTVAVIDSKGRISGTGPLGSIRRCRLCSRRGGRSEYRVRVGGSGARVCVLLAPGVRSFAEG
ncbi:hypothetical protein San01_44040 [Streptomyces angustmyceticus]|uniref:Uncharacterized protein n=1 Tax=Streptomyces angustmyceticus TaxID=285578 RepID=A0A5J4LC80_9ACTN|nr:hypothetical protein San01_44040 [Streptomyces angustmyceticus]